jgi:hypothetical protein
MSFTNKKQYSKRRGASSAQEPLYQQQQQSPYSTQQYIQQQPMNTQQAVHNQQEQQYNQQPIYPQYTQQQQAYNILQYGIPSQRDEYAGDIVFDQGVYDWNASTPQQQTAQQQYTASQYNMPLYNTEQQYNAYLQETVQTPAYLPMTQVQGMQPLSPEQQAIADFMTVNNTAEQYIANAPEPASSQDARRLRRIYEGYLQDLSSTVNRIIALGYTVPEISTQYNRATQNIGKLSDWVHYYNDYQ